MAFSASPPDPIDPEDSIIAENGFWPDLDVADFRRVRRVSNSTLPFERIREALIAAIETVDGQLTDWRTNWETLGTVALDDVPGPMRGGENRYVMLWRRAVYSAANADLAESHRDITATGEGHDRADEVTNGADAHKRNMIHAIRDILGVRRTAVELI